MRQAIITQGLSDSILPFKTRHYPYCAWIGFIGNIFFIFFQGWTSFAPWDVKSFFMNYVVIIVFLFLFVAWKLYHKTQWVRLEECDLSSRRHIVPRGLHME